jgi:putative acetyltransferase
MSRVLEIRRDDVTGADVVALIRLHLESMHAQSPPESVHALGLDALRRPDVTFWSVWDGAELAGCGALKELDREHGEIKSMRTAPEHLRKGVAARLLDHIVAEAKRRSYRRISLETGSTDGFVPALKLYERFGFERCGPFGDYRDDPFSIFMTKAL